MFGGLQHCNISFNLSGI